MARFEIADIDHASLGEAPAGADNPDAIRLRREVADQMSEREIAEAQRAARAWLKAG
jgi:tryptophanyl-tRNA synthetase